MLVKNARVYLPTLVDFIRHPHAGQNVESKILTLRSTHVRVTVDPTQTEAAGKIGNNSPVRSHKIITPAEVDAKIMVFHAAEDRLRHQGQTKLIVTAGPTPKAFGAVIHTPANSTGDKLRPDLITVRVVENAEQVTG